MEEPSNLFDLPNIDQIRWYIANAFCNYKDVIEMNNNLEENITILESENKELKNRSMRRKQYIRKLEKENKMLQEKLERTSSMVGVDDLDDQINFLNSKIKDLKMDVIRYRDMSLRLLEEKRKLQSTISSMQL